MRIVERKGRKNGNYERSKNTYTKREREEPEDRWSATNSRKVTRHLRRQSRRDMGREDMKTSERHVVIGRCDYKTNTHARDETPRSSEDHTQPSHRPEKTPRD